MKWIKANVFLLSTSIIVLAALALWYFFIIGSMHDDLKTAMEARADKVDIINTLIQPDLTIPGVVGPQQRPITQEMVTAKKLAQDQLKHAADQINQIAAQQNRQNRLNDQDIPLMGGKPQPGLLPITVRGAADPSWDFKTAYLQLFDTWYARLVFDTDKVPPTPASLNGFAIPLDKGALLNGYPPQTGDLSEAWTLQKERIDQNATHRAGTGRIVNSPNPNLTDKTVEDQFTRQYISAWNSQYKMYGSKAMFQIRPWAFGESAPDETAIFDALVDVWVQQDLVKAIQVLNQDSSSVFTSPVKYCERMNVGASAAAVTSNGSPFSIPTSNPTQGSTIPGEVFLGALAAPAGGGPPGAPSSNAPPRPSGPDFTKSMTGRVGADSFDVTHFSLVIHIEPNKLNAFINELYSLNNGYTILNIKIDAINPFEAASNGFIYGRVPVIRAEITGEALFFRDWTSKIMPNSIRPLLNPPMALYVPPPPPGAAPAPAAAPPGVPSH